MKMYRQYRNDTMVLVQGAVKRNASEDQYRRFAMVSNMGPLKTAVFEMLLLRYRRERKINRRQMRRMMEEGTFWEDFLEFLQNVDWNKVLEIVMKIVEMILAIG